MLTSNPTTVPAHGPLSWQELATISGGKATVLSQSAIRDLQTALYTNPYIKSVREHSVKAFEFYEFLTSETDPRRRLGRGLGSR